MTFDVKSMRLPVDGARGRLCAVERGRWDALFADLEGELAGERARDLDGEIDDRTRAEHARLTLADRLAAHRGERITVTTTGGPSVSGPLTDAAKDWLLVGDVLVPRTSVLTIAGLGSRARDPDARPLKPLTLGYALRRMPPEVTCVLTDGRVLTATIERVGKDHVDLGGHAVPFRVIAVIRPA